jgi:hypothetical protein
VAVWAAAVAAWEAAAITDSEVIIREGSRNLGTHAIASFAAKVRDGARWAVGSRELRDSRAAQGPRWGGLALDGPKLCKNDGAWAFWTDCSCARASCMGRACPRGFCSRWTGARGFRTCRVSARAFCADLCFCMGCAGAGAFSATDAAAPCTTRAGASCTTCAAASCTGCAGPACACASFSAAHAWNCFNRASADGSLIAV